MKKWAVVLVILGIAIIVYPLVSDWNARRQEQQLYEAYQAAETAYQAEIAAANADLSAAFAAAPAAEVAEAAPLPPAAATPADTEQEILGELRIPQIDVSLLILEGASADQLRLGVGHVSATPLPGATGNCALAAHRMRRFFLDLDQLAVGDEVQITYAHQEYTYQVYEILTVLPEDTSVLNQTDEEAVLTLITCTPKGKRSHRLVLHCRLLPAEAAPTSDPPAGAGPAAGEEVDT